MATTSLLCRSNRPLQMFRLALLLLGAMMLIFDAIGFASYKDFIIFVGETDTGMQQDMDDSKGFYALPFYPDILTTAFYTLILALVYRRNRAPSFSSVAEVPASSSPFLSFSAWCVLRILFTLVLSGLMLYAPFKEIGDILRVVRIFKKISESRGKGFTQNFGTWYLCGSRPSSDDQGSAVSGMWLWNGCVIRRTRSIIAIAVGFLILVELAWSLKKAQEKKRSVSPRTTAIENENEKK
ncbi:hypothetical protein EMPS_04196 [Entomortierella parvispora]|uniref:Uncharacterized protein n=1 Tax=Entomortierella parvispora TaxID=205924 RepID=A0A9P3H859_9FUNG|nr:hypothetical protein EMPS_04196 [Entomortierella parvispora]